MKCGKSYDAEYVFNSKNIPLCNCGGTIKPDVVLYGEALDDKVIDESIKSIMNADMLIVAGTSLTVFPACNLIRYFKGKYLVIINRDKTPSDNIADLVIHESLGKVFKDI